VNNFFLIFHFFGIYLEISTFKIQVMLDRAGSGIESFDVGSFWISDPIRSGRDRSNRVSSHLGSNYFRFWVASGRVGYWVPSGRVGTDRMGYRVI
jgi:hypothetical protein